MRNIDSYDWDVLYEKAENFIQKYIPDSHVNRGIKSFYGGKPRAEVSFIKKEIGILLKNLIWQNYAKTVRIQKAKTQ